MKQALSLLVALSVLAAGAGEASAVSRADRKLAKELYKQAVEFKRANKHADACEAYGKSYNLQPSYKVLWEAARSCDEAKQGGKAAGFYKLYLAERRASWKLRKLAVDRLVALSVALHEEERTEAEKQEDELKSAQKKKEAERYYTEGSESFARERYEQAVKAFTLAYELYPKAVIALYNIAKSYERLGDGEKCITYFDRYLDAYRKANKRNDPPDIKDIENTKLKCKLGTKIELTIETDPIGAAVYVDDKDKLLGTTPYKLRLDAGTYNMLLESSGYEPLEQKIEVRAGEARRLSFKLEKKQYVGHIRVKTNIQGALLLINARPHGTSPFTAPIPLGMGSHQIKLQKQDYNTFTQQLGVEADRTYDLDADLFLRESGSTWKKPLGWSLLVPGVLAIGGAVAAGVHADTLFKGTPDFELYRDLQKWGFVGGGVAAGLGLVFLIWEVADTNKVKPEDEIDSAGASAPTIRPQIVPVAAGAVVGADVSF